MFIILALLIFHKESGRAKIMMFRKTANFITTYPKIMYYIALFVEYPSLLKEKLSSFLQNNFSNIWICKDQQESPLQSLEDLPDHSGYWYPQSWYIYSPRIDTARVQKLLKFPLYNGAKFKTSFEEIDYAFSSLSTNYLWSIFPWGGSRRFLSFGFLSRERHLCEQFVNASSSFLSAAGKGNILISNYQVTASFSQLIKAILFDGYDRPASRLWDVCNCDATPPWLITNIFDEEIFSIFDWGGVPEYTFINSLESTGEYIEPLGIYEPLNKKSFQIMCMLSFQDPNTLLWIPQGMDLEKLRNLLNDIEDDNSCSDLKYIREILSVTPWFYGLDRDRSDHGNSLFIAQDNNLLHKFNELEQNDNYRLISCF